MDYSVVDPETVNRIESEKLDTFPASYRVLTGELGIDEMRVNVWYYEPGDKTAYHAHRQQEEVFYVLAGEFELMLGDPDEKERHRVGPGTLYAAGPGVGHGHRLIGDEPGTILAIGAPAVDDDFLHPDAL